MLRVTVSGPLGSGTHGRGTYTWLVTDDETTDLLDALPVPRVGFQGIAAVATVGGTSWKTSVFPSNGGFLLLIAKRVREAEGLVVGQQMTAHLDIIGTL